MLMNNGSDSLAGNIVPALIFIFLGVVVVFTLIAMVHYVWTVPRQSSERLHQIAKKGKDVPFYLASIVGADIVLWLARSSGIYADVSFNDWIAIIAAVDIWVLSLTLTLALGAMLARRRIHALEAHEKPME